MIKMKPLLKESTWVDRKFGEPLPTIEDYMSETYNDEDCGDGHAVVSEADDDKYVSVGWGKYKEKGKEDDKNAPTFTKTDSGKYVKAGDDKKGAKPKKKGKALGKGDFGRDLDDDEDDYDMGVEPTSRGAGGWTPKDRTGDESPEEYKSMIKQQEKIVQDLIDKGADREEIEDAEGEIDVLKGEFEDNWYDTGVEPGSRDTGPWTPEDDPDDIDNLDTALDDDPTRGDPDDAWDDEEGRAKPTGKTDADTDDDEYAISGTDSDDPAGGKGDAWMTGHDDDDVHQKGMAKAKDLAKKGMEKRPGGEQAELDYQKADQMLMKYAGVDIEKAEYWAKKKRQASNAMMGEITIDGKKYKPITENIEPTIFNPQEEIKKVWDKIKTRQFDRKWKKEII